MEEIGFAVNREMQLVAFRVGREDFGVDVRKVDGVISMVDITRMPRTQHFVEGIINLRGQIVAVVDLASRLGIEGAERGSATRIVVVESQEVKVGLIVDSPEVINVSAGALEASPMLASSEVNTAFIKGIAKLDDKLLILLDVDKVLSDRERSDIDEMDLSDQENSETPET